MPAPIIRKVIAKAQPSATVAYRFLSSEFMGMLATIVLFSCSICLGSCVCKSTILTDIVVLILGVLFWFSFLSQAANMV